MLSYQQRAENFKHPLAKKLFLLMENKKSNLALSADVTSKHEILALANLLGPEICVLKLHVDVIEDFDHDFIQQLTALAQQHQFLIFEDRKFADIGNTVQLQYKSGVYRICEWADIVNAHLLPGPGIIAGLKEVGLPLQRGLLLIAELSSANNLIDEEYIQQTLQAGDANSDFVIGFIAQRRHQTQHDFIVFTPGIHLHARNDQLGQQYLTPEMAILERGSDVLIVGRNIYQNAEPLKVAQELKQISWNAYLQRLT